MTDLRDFHKHDHQKNTLRRISRAVCGTERKNPQPHERSNFPNICENWRGWKVPCFHLISDKRLHERPNFSVLKNCACWCCCEDNASRPTPAALWKCLHQRWSPVSKRFIYLFAIFCLLNVVVVILNFIRCLFRVRVSFRPHWVSGWVLTELSDFLVFFHNRTPLIFVESWQWRRFGFSTQVDLESSFVSLLLPVINM